ncbi:MAG: tetratricopeptide repeat protein [Terriglobales bacterium]
MQLFTARQPGAAAAFRNLRRQYPRWWLPEYYLGRLAERDQEPAEAALRLVRAARLAPRQPTPRAALAVLAGRQGFWADASGQWQKYLRMAPADAPAWREWAIAAHMASQPRRALAAMQHYLAARPDDARAQYLYALMLRHNGDLSGAAAALRRSLRFSSRFSPAWDAQARWQMDAGQLSAARQSLDAALAASPGDARAWAELGAWERKRGHPELALPLLLRARQLAPDNARILYALAQTDLALHNPQAARAAQRDFQRLRAEQQPPAGDVHAPTLLAWARAEAGRTPAQRRRDYLALLRRLLRQNPGAPQVLCRLARVEWAADPAAARRHLSEALAHAPEFADAVRTADWLAAAGETALARKFYAAALRQPAAAQDASAALGLARLDLAAHQYQAALDAANAVPAAALPPGAAAEMAALAHAALGQPAAAQAAFRLALAMNPKQVAWYREDAVFLASAGKWTAALKVLAVGRRNCGPSLRLALTRGILLQLSGRRQDAQAQLQTTIAAAARQQRSAVRHQAQLLLAISYLTTDQGARAGRLLRMLNRDAPQLAEAWYYRARLERQHGQTATALRHARRAAQLAPKYAPAWLLAGRLEQARGATAAAGQDYQRAAQDEPDWTAPHQALRDLDLRLGRAAAARREQQTVVALQQAAPTASSRQMQSALLGVARQ